MRNLFIILSFIFFESEISAQNPSDTVIHIDEVRISDSKINNSVFSRTEIIDTCILNQNSVNALSDLLSENTFVFIKSYGQGSLATASIRGTAASHTQILWNGILLNNPMLGQADLSLIPIFFIDKAETAEGGTSLFSVSGALGGAIMLNSVPDFGKRLSATFIQTAGSFGTYQTFFKIGAGNLKFHNEFKIFREKSENDFLFFNNANGTGTYEKQQNADYKKTGLMNELSFKITDNKMLNINTRIQFNDRNIPPVMSFQGSNRKENQQNTDFYATFNYSAFGKKLSSKINGGFISENMNYFLADKTETELFIHTNSDSKTRQFFAKYQGNYKANSKLLFQTELNVRREQAHYFDRTNQSRYDADRKIAELFFSSHYEFNKNITAYILFRENYTDYAFLPIMPSVGFRYFFPKKFPLSIKTTFSRNYHNPSLNDLYWIPGGNSDLKPEKAYSADLNLTYELFDNKTFSVSTNITGYYSYTDNWIVWRPSEFHYWRAENIRKVLSRGIECSLSGKLNSGKFNLRFKSNYAYTKTTNETEEISEYASSGKQLIYIPLHKLNTLINFEYRQYYVNFTHTFTGERYTTSSNVETRHILPSFNLFHITGGKKFILKKIKIETQIKIRNLFNKNYQEILWRAMPGRQYIFSLRIDY